jgi:HEAT repeat protein
MTGGGENSEYRKRLDHFLGMLKDENPSQRWKATEGLARILDERAVEPLIDELSDEDWRVRQKAAWALGVIGDHKAILPLRRALMQERESVKEIIMEVLDRIKSLNR